MRLRQLNKYRVMQLMDGNFPAKKFEELYPSCQTSVLSTIRPRYTYKIVDSDDNFLYPIALNLSGLIKKYDKIALLAVTLSVEIEMILSKAVLQDTYKAAVLEAMANLALHDSCSLVVEEFSEEYDHWDISHYYSPSLGDFPLSLNGELLQLLDGTKKIGLSLNKSGQFIPKKSLVAVVGLKRPASS